MGNIGIASENKETIWNQSFISIFIVNIIMNMCQFMINTLIPKYADHLGATASIVGIVSGLFAVTALSIRPIAGPAMDYYRKNRLLSAAIASTILAYICYGWAGNIQMIAVARLIHGVGLSVTGPISLAIASDTLPESKMASGIGIFSLAQAIATAVGPTIGLSLADSVGYNITFFICAIVMFSCLLLSLRLQTGVPERTEGFKISIDKVIAPEVIVPSIITFFLYGAYSTITYFIVIYGGLRGVENIGLFFTVYAVCLLVSRPISGRIADKYGIDKIMIPGTLIFALAFIVISIAKTLPLFLLAGAISAFGFGICSPLIQTLCMQLVARERRGAAGNTNYMGIDSGYLIAPAIAGVLVTSVQKSTGSEIIGYVVMFRAMILPVIVALILYWLWRKREPRNSRQ